MALTKQQILDLVSEFPIDGMFKLPAIDKIVLPAVECCDGSDSETCDELDHEFMKFLASGDFLDIELPVAR